MVVSFLGMLFAIQVGFWLLDDCCLLVRLLFACFYGCLLIRLIVCYPGCLLAIGLWLFASWVGCLLVNDGCLPFSLVVCYPGGLLAIG